MGPAVVQYRFERLPSAFRYFPRAVFGRRNALVPDGQVVPRLEARVDTVSANRRHLGRYRDVCGFADDGCLPLTYPHVIAMPIQFAILTHPRFPVRLMGLVHIANDIHQARSLPESGRFELRSWIEGHRDVDRGHEFDLFTSVEDGQGTAWLEKSTLLARRTSGGKRASRGVRQALRYETPPEGSHARVGRHHGASRHRPPLRMALRRPQSDPSRRSRRASVRIRARRRPWNVVDGTFVRGPRARRACVARAGAGRVQVPALLAGTDTPRALGQRRQACVCAEGFRERAAARRGIHAARLRTWPATRSAS